MGLADDAAETVRIGLWSDAPAARTVTLPTEVYNELLTSHLELARRNSAASSYVEQAMNRLVDVEANDARYWAMKELDRARDMLREGKCR